MQKRDKDLERIAPIQDQPMPPVTINQPGGAFSNLIIDPMMDYSMLAGGGPLFTPTREHAEQLAAHFAEENPKLSD